MEFLATISLTQAFLVAQICPNLHKIMSCWKGFYVRFDKSVLQGMLMLGGKKRKLWAGK